MTPWADFTQASFDPFAGGEIFLLAQDPDRPVSPQPTVLAARVKREPEGEDNGVDAVFVADLDMISDLFFNLRDSPEALERGLTFDNIAFTLNAVDVLAGREEFLPLRRRRADRRTLTRVEAETARFLDELRAEEDAAQQKVDDALDLARQRFEKQREALEARDDLSPRAKAQLLDAAAREEERRLAIQEERERQKLRAAVAAAEDAKDRNVAAAETRFKRYAVALPPVPAIILGLGVLLIRLLKERRDVDPDRTV